MTSRRQNFPGYYVYISIPTIQSKPLNLTNPVKEGPKCLDYKVFHFLSQRMKSYEGVLMEMLYPTSQAFITRHDTSNLIGKQVLPAFQLATKP